VERCQFTWQLGRFALGLLVLFGLVTLLAHTLGPELEALGRMFFVEASYPGVALGTLLADGFFFPVPPQFHMLLATASGASQAWLLASICIGSVLGGVLGFSLARRLSHVSWFRRRVLGKSTRQKLHANAGLKTMAGLSLTPIAFSWLIYFCGISRYPTRFLVLLCTLRSPPGLPLLAWDFVHSGAPQTTSPWRPVAALKGRCALSLLMSAEGDASRTSSGTLDFVRLDANKYGLWLAKPQTVPTARSARVDSGIGDHLKYLTRMALGVDDGGILIGALPENLPGIMRPHNRKGGQLWQRSTSS
jgi:membrane protein YqaA with SNARE-associated domain